MNNKEVAMPERKELFDWFWKQERTFDIDEVTDLVERICEFNCGAIDEYLTKHAKKSLDEWLEEKQK